MQIAQNHTRQNLSLQKLAAEQTTIPAVMQRVVAEGGLKLKRGAGGRTRIERLFQSGAGKIRLPKTTGNAVEAVLINTAGGLTGGDQVNWQVEMAGGTDAVVTTQACEKIYKSSGGSARVETNICLNGDAHLAWLPQETILFEKAHLSRNLQVELGAEATFMALEPVMLGREAMGEHVSSVTFEDSWRIHRNGKLLHAEEMNLSGDILQQRLSAAGLHTNRAFASFLYCEDTGWETLERKATHWASDLPEICAGLSVLPGRITGRFVAADSYHLRQVLLPFLGRVRDGLPLPKVWNI